MWSVSSSSRMTTMACVSFLLSLLMSGLTLVHGRSLRSVVFPSVFCRGKIMDTSYVDPKDCSYYYQCGEYYSSRQRCGSGMFFSESIQRCTYPEYVSECQDQFRGTTEENSHFNLDSLVDSEEIVIAQSDESFGSEEIQSFSMDSVNKNSNSKSNGTLDSVFVNVKSSEILHQDQDPFCTGKAPDFYADPNSCMFFYQCSMFINRKHQCAQGTVFNPSKLKCDDPTSVPACNREITSEIPEMTQSTQLDLPFLSQTTETPKGMQIVTESANENNGNLRISDSATSSVLFNSVNENKAMTESVPGFRGILSGNEKPENSQTNKSLTESLINETKPKRTNEVRIEKGTLLSSENRRSNGAGGIGNASPESPDNAQINGAEVLTTDGIVKSKGNKNINSAVDNKSAKTEVPWKHENDSGITKTDDDNDGNDNIFHNVKKSVVKQKPTISKSNLPKKGIDVHKTIKLIKKAKNAPNRSPDAAHKKYVNLLPLLKLLSKLDSSGKKSLQVKIKTRDKNGNEMKTAVFPVRFENGKLVIAKKRKPVQNIRRRVQPTMFPRNPFRRQSARRRLFRTRVFRNRLWK